MPVRCARRTRIVIADDHASVRAELRSLLEDQLEFIVVGEASDGLEAIALARALSPDVILMDVSMPNVDGIEATRHIHTEFPTIRIFGLSTQDRTGATVHPIEAAGASDYFIKGDDIDRLLNRLVAVHTARIDS